MYPKRTRRSALHPLWLLCVPLALLTVGCGSRSVGHGNNAPGVDAGPTECVDVFDCNPGVTCGDLIPCEAGRCDPGAGHVIIPCTFDECTTAADCVVAVPGNCCFGCPQVVSVQALSELPCFFAPGEVPDPPPPECDMDCFWCEPCVPQPLGAMCDDGLCVPTDLGCPEVSELEVAQVTTAQLQQSVADHEGQLRRVRGVVIPGEGSCDGEGCTAHYAAMLNGVVQLEGHLCGMTVDLVGEECRANLRAAGASPGGWYELDGIVREPISAAQPPRLEVVGSRLIDPEDIGGVYPSLVTEVEDDNPDPTCTPAWWSVGDPVTVFLAQSGPQVRVSAPAFHCEANFSGGFDPGEADSFTTQLPIDCLDCEYTISGTVVNDLLSGEYVLEQGGCRYVIRFEGTRPHPYP